MDERQTRSTRSGREIPSDADIRYKKSGTTGRRTTPKGSASGNAARNQRRTNSDRRPAEQAVRTQRKVNQSARFHKVPKVKNADSVGNIFYH